MIRTVLIPAALLGLPQSLAAQQGEECLGYDLTHPDRSIPMDPATDAWSLYNLGPGRVVIRSSTGETLPGPAPSSQPRPTAFQGDTDKSYAITLEGPGLAIVYICPED
ncbi:hypothetical protein [Maliponia aquimaris]|uniref:Uncharacterized protein n=1 Tax=Maliponia aquimaris TaxID=1673631 RepID=A0A238L2C4_9RHOB|nr:hypothetical protein [Maliponia aquimaris]SMX49245.1 hypothetical protein MAA8898_04235 [Maliponia aquimaris]